MTPPALKDEADQPSAARVLAHVAEALGERALLQIGGDETIGRGLTRVRRYGKATAKEAKVQEGGA